MKSICDRTPFGDLNIVYSIGVLNSLKYYLNIVYSIGVLNLLTLVEPEVSTECFYICCGSLI